MQLAHGNIRKRFRCAQFLETRKIVSKPEGYAVQAPADLCDGATVSFGREVGFGGPRPLGEEPDRAVFQRIIAGVRSSIFRPIIIE